MRRVLGVGLGLSLSVAVALSLGGLPTMDALLLAALLVALPALAVAQLLLLPPGGIDRVSAYLSSIVSLVVLGVLGIAVGARGRGIEGLGLGPMPVPRLVVWTGGLLGTVGVVIVLFRALAIRWGYHEPELLRQLLPRTRGEKGLFVALSACAGLGEEIAYRGYVIAVLSPLTGPVGAAVVGSSVFGVLHVYQGWLGIPRAALLGGVFAWGYLWSGSLWPPILAHFLVDVLAGLVFTDWLLGDSDLPPRSHPVTVAPPGDVGRN